MNKYSINRENKANIVLVQFISPSSKQASAPEMQAENLGKPLKVLEFSSNEKDNLNFEEIEKFFNNPKIKQRKVVILSIVGAFRRGKSFFLDYCLRYLYANYDSINRSNFVKDSNWMGYCDEELSGFSWRSGCDRDTTGIVFWDDVFLADSDNKKFAIFIADTQGLFDHETTSGENTKVFSLVSLFSSTQIINLSGNIREDELQFVSFAMEFAKYVKPNIEKPFQNVVFLIRDWQCEEDFSYGRDGGQKYLQKVFKGKSDQKKEFSSIREFLLTSCEDLECFLLPHPGKNVAGKKNFNGSWAQMEIEFYNELKKTIESLLAPENLVPKKIAGKDLTAKEFLPHLKQFFKLFASKEIPQVGNLFDSMVKIEMNQLEAKLLKIYNLHVKNLMYSVKYKSQVLEIHENIKREVLKKFYSDEKLGSQNHIDDAKMSLILKIDESYKQWSENKINQLEKEEIQRQLFEAKVKMELNRLVENYLLKYNLDVEDLINLAKDKNQISEIHEMFKGNVLINFERDQKLGNENQIKEAEKSLISKIDESYKHLRDNKINQLEKQEIQRQNEEIRRQQEVKMEKLRSEREAEKKISAEKEESLKKELMNARVTRSVGYSSGISSFPSSFFDSCSSPPTPNYNSYSSFSGSSRASTPSQSSGNSWHQHQKHVSANVWSQMSSSERKSAGNFNTFAAASYRKK